MLFSVASTKLGGAGSRQETETGFRFQNRKRKLVSVSKIGNENMETGFRFQNRKRKPVSVSKIRNKNTETRERYPPCPDTAKWQDEAALSPPFQIWLSGRPTLLDVASIISS